jgi:hypothetical protein
VPSPSPSPAPVTSTPNGQVIPDLPYEDAVAQYSTKNRRGLLGQCNPVGIILDDQDRHTFIFGTNATAGFTDPIAGLRDQYLVPVLRNFFKDASLGYDCEVTTFPTARRFGVDEVGVDTRYYGVSTLDGFATTNLRTR